MFIINYYKFTINKALQQYSDPVPVVCHLLASLSDGAVFVKLGLTQAYQQLPVTDESAKAQTIVTIRGAFTSADYNSGPVSCLVFSRV